MSSEPEAQAIVPLAETQVPAPAEAVGKSLCGSTGASSGRLAATLMRATLSGTPVSPKATPEQRDEKLGSALDLAAAFKPQDGVQGAMATMCASLFFGANTMLQKSANPHLPPQLSVAFAKTAARLSDAFVSMSETIQRRQGGGATHQRVVVEHVTVQAGGQAVVGAVAARKGGGGDGV